MMSDIENLMAADAVHEWIGVHDSRLLAVTGHNKVNEDLGAALRRYWRIRRGEDTILAKGVARLIIPNPNLRVTTQARVDTIDGYLENKATVHIAITNFADAASFLPLIDENIAIDRPETEHMPAIRAWTMLGRAGTLGLAVFAEDLRYPGKDSISPDVELRVQAARSGVLTRLSSL